MKLTSLIGIILAVLAICCLAVTPVAPLNFGGDFSQKTIIRVVEPEGASMDELLSMVKSVAGSPKVLLKSENFLLLEISKPYSENLAETLRQSFSDLGVGSVEIFPVSAVFSLSFGRVLICGIVSFILTGIVAFIVSRRKRTIILFPLVSLLTFIETVGILSLWIPIDPEVLLTSVLIAVLFPLTSGIFLLNPIKSQEGMRKLKISALIFFAGIIAAAASLSTLSLMVGTLGNSLIALVLGVVVGIVNLYWLAGGLLFQPAPKEAVTYYVSF
ncbi:MAG: hypothetical protein QXX33_03470 [Candidatus Hadarchaeales archaeon]